MLWIPITIGAAAFQVMRNALQRGLLGDAGPWGATLVRFLFGLPFTLVAWAIASLLTPLARPTFSLTFWLAASSGALCQLLASAALLVAMRRAGFAIGTALQQSSLPLSAVIGLAIFHDNLTNLAWVGVAITTCGLAVLTWPKGATGPQPLSGALFGLISGLCFGFSLNAFRHAEMALEPTHHVLAAVASVCVAQALQSSALTAMLAWRRPQALKAVIASWRQSLGAGFCGAIASLGWFTAIGFSPAGPVRAVGMVEMPMAALAGRRMLAERLTLWQWAAGVATALGVVLAALG
ncbi:MAG TPA: DMT family transporter [Caulobacteraceae bacterium]|jgi:drug/metabolite transporter (DMT)-like permease|nr:DMT family transporter [Caulobacteraceae bacterium]